MTPSDTLDPLDNLGPPFNPSRPRYLQKFDDFHVRYVRHGLNKAFTEACRRHGYRNYWALEKLVEHFIRTGVLPTATAGELPQVVRPTPKLLPSSEPKQPKTLSES